MLYNVFKHHCFERKSNCFKVFKTHHANQNPIKQVLSSRFYQCIPIIVRLFWLEVFCFIPAAFFFFFFFFFFNNFVLFSSFPLFTFVHKYLTVKSISGTVSMDSHSTRSSSLRKLALAIYRDFFSVPKIENFTRKNVDIFLIFAQNIDCGYTLEPPR